MKALLLNTAVCDNGGARRDAGESLTIGTKPDQIASDRAKALVASGAAVSGSADSSPTASLHEAGSPILPDSASDEAE